MVLPWKRNTTQRRDVAVKQPATSVPRQWWGKLPAFLAGMVAFPVVAAVTGFVVAIVMSGASEGSQAGPLLF